MKILFSFIAVLFSTLTFAHQPVMDMAPRWNNGLGVQVRNEHTSTKNTQWLESVYTFQRAVRMTLKVPLVDEKIGDSLFAVPLKKYTNKGAFTSNFGLTPSLRLPTGGGNKWDAGLSLSYSAESLKLYQLYDLYALADKIALDINVGLVHASGKGSSLFTLWDISAQKSRFGERVLSGPVLIYFKRNLVARAQYKVPIYDHDKSWSGNFSSIGIGIVH